MLTPEEIFITDYTSLFVDLYRFGNSVSPSKDAKIQDRNGIKYILADGNGISAFSSIPTGSGHTWKQ